MPLAAVTAKKKSTGKKESKPKAGGGGRKKKEKVWSSTLKKSQNEPWNVFHLHNFTMCIEWPV